MPPNSISSSKKEHLRDQYIQCIISLEDEHTVGTQMQLVYDQRRILEELLGYSLTNTKDEPSSPSQNSPYGNMIPPHQAADCICDANRTIRFQRAIIDYISRINKEKAGPINILYAGCGPYAALLLPALVICESIQMKVWFVDIFDESLSSVRNIISSLHVESTTPHFLKRDACKLNLHNESIPPLDLVICETMDAGLLTEPQAAIMHNLARQCKEECTFIPNKIELSLTLANYPSLIEYLLSTPGYNSAPHLERISTALGPLRLNSTTKQHTDLGILKTISAEEARLEIDIEEFIKIHKEFLIGDHEDLLFITVMTRVKIYDNFNLDPCESLITRPIPFNIVLENQKKIDIRYSCGRLRRAGEKSKLF